MKRTCTVQSKKIHHLKKIKKNINNFFEVLQSLKNINDQIEENKKELNSLQEENIFLKKRINIIEENNSLL